MMRALGREGGFSFVSILLAMLLLAVLYFGYFRLSSSSGEKGAGIQSLQTSKGIACRTQRQQIERDVQAYSMSHDGPPHSLAELEREGIRVPSCPEGGRYALAGIQITCSTHP
ncbi:MAG: hypothetical protein HY699_06595 [Deltaproteobacteria bacterium]|nr:hypothetical protein [Deltaproteobacteria bacterium]